jgi:capsular exopolysaccharide synthesis family protein
MPTPEQRLITITNPNSPGAETFRVLSTRLAHLRRKRPLKKLLITSAVGDEGKSVVSVNLALTLARRAGERVLLIEADLRRPTASALLASSPLRGISEWHEHKLALQDAFYQVEGLPLWLLSAGKGIEEPLPLLESDAFAQMLAAVSEGFDWVLLDCTPMLPMADATSLSRLCDGVLVVAREGHTRKRTLIRALASIEKNKQLGFIFNEASMVQVGYERYYGGYGYYGSKKSNGDEEAKTDHTASA